MISVIIPVYNAEKTIRQCLRSVLRQDYADFEMLLVNDASKDRSLEICLKYAADDNRIKVIDLPENGGVENARYIGLEAAKGEFVFFMDADDWLSNRRVFSTMVSIATQTGADYVEVGLQNTCDKYGIFKKKPKNLRYRELEGKPLKDMYFSFFGINHLSVNIWGKLYKKATLDKMDYRPAGLKFGEDLYFNMKLFRYLKKIVVLDFIGYSYRWGGGTSRYLTGLLDDSKKLFRLKENEIETLEGVEADNKRVMRWFIREELKNVLRSHIQQRMIHLESSKEEIISTLKEEMEDPVYAAFEMLYENPERSRSPFIRALKEKDYGTIYDLCQQRNKAERPRRLVKNILYKLFG